MRKQLSKKDIKDINSVLNENFGLDCFISKKDDVYLEDGLVYINKEPCFFYIGEKLVPTLKLVLKVNFLKKIVIDMPAVKFIANGADVMRPGIKEVDGGINAGDVVAIVDENNKKPIAVGIASLDSEGLRTAEGGKVIKNVHHVGDNIWSR
ncbi:DUF1947 domain-containing protein [Candidatus Woesearchaeota archaeon]|nr:DUF1947 domain-containing protein [Candidatus Woesearchaeota archaeon]MBW3021452.1 DUF1947 domain-containing protein [Candidatus Woesearchaeota archaeon]